jgi:uncharacterized protein (TIGR03435 family)
MDSAMPVLSLLGKVTLVLALALLAVSAARRTRAALRASILTAAFAAVALLPLAALVVPVRAVAVPVAAEPLSFVFFDESPVAAAADAGRGDVPGAPGPASAWPLPSPGTALRAGWMAGTVAFAIPLVIAIRRVHRMRRAGLRWPDGQAALDALADQTHIARPVAIFLHPHLDAPMTCGVRRPAIGLPADAVDWPLADLQRALVHELEHVRRMDWAVHMLARAACAAYWFHPLAWMAWRRLCLESERACDDAVVRQADGAAYAQQLLWLARRLSNRPVPMLSMAAPSSLSTRVRAVLDTAQARGRAGALSLLAVAAGAMALVTAISPLQATPRPQSSSPASMPADPTLRFPVASVRPADPSDRSRGFGYTLETGRLNLRNQTLRTMIGVAFSEPFGLFFPDERISGGPEWLNDERFTIQARAERPVSNAEMGALLRALLRDRFALRVRTETREQPIYALVIARQDRGLGPELRPAVKDCAAGGRCGIGGGAGRYELAGATMPLLAALLGEALGRPVVDRTGLDGSFEGRLTFAPPLEAAGALGEPTSGAAAADPGPSIFTALEEQFGLKLQSERGPVEYLVIESADRPTPNDAPDTPARDAAGAAPQAGAAGASFDVASIRRNASNEALVRGGHAPSIFTAIQEQLGLKLEPAVGPVTVLVVDRIQRPTRTEGRT